MTPEELQAWLEARIDDIVTFMDYEPTIESHEQLAGTLRYWFDKEGWNDGQRFVHLGIDGMGSQYAAWVRADGAPVVFFGSEGGRGVLAKSPADWAKALAHAPYVEEYRYDDAELDASRLVEGGLEEDDEDAAEALATYRAVVEAKFGTLPELEDLTADMGVLNAEFLAWVESRLS